MDQPAIGILQVRVQVLVFLQRRRGPQGQLSEESGRVGCGLRDRLEADLLLGEVELVADEVVEVVLEAHAVVQHLEGLQGRCVFAHSACHVAHLLVICGGNRWEVTQRWLQDFQPRKQSLHGT